MPMSPLYFSRQQVATVNVSTDDLVIHRIDNFNQTTNIPRLVVSSPPSRPSRLPPPQSSSSPSTSYSPPVSSPTRHKEDWAADLALMNRIKGCRNWRDLLNLSSCTSMTDRSWNHVHCSAALTHLAKLSSPPKSTSSKQSGYNSIMDNHIIESWGEVEDLIARLCALLASRMSACKPRQVANSTWALAKIYTGLLKPYAELKRLNEDDSVKVLMVDDILLATVRALLIRSHRWMDKSHPSHIPPFNPQELSNLIYSVASLSSSGSAHGRSSEPLVILPDGWVERWIKAASHPQIKSSLSPQSFANIAWSFTQLAFPPSSSSSSYPLPSYLSASFDPSGPSWVERAQEWLSALCLDHTMSEISSISPLAVGVEGGARTDRTNKRPPLSSHDTPSLAVLSWSLAKMDVMPSEAWLISFFNTTQARLAHMTARDLSNVAWAVSSWSRAAYRSSSSLWALSVSAKHPPSSPGGKDARDQGGWGDEEGSSQGGDQSKSSIRSPPSLLPLPLSQTSVTYPSTSGSPEDGQQTESKWGDLISSRQRERNAAERRRKRLFRSSDSSPSSTTSSPSSTTSTSSEVSMSEGEEEMTSSRNPSLARRFNRFSPNNSSSTQSEPSSINNTVSCSSLEDDLSPIPSSSVSSGSHEGEGMTSDVQLSRTTASLKEVFGYWKDELLSQFELRASGTLHLMSSSPTSSSPSSGSKTSSRPLQLLSSRGSGSHSGQETSNSSSSYKLLVTPYDSRPDWWRLDPLSFSSLCSSLEALKLPLTQTLVRLPPRPPSPSPSPSPSSSLSTGKDGGRNHPLSSHMQHQQQSNSSVINGRRSKRIERFQSSSPPDFTSSSSSSTSSPPYQPSPPWSSPAHRSTQGPIHEASPPISPPLISFASWLLEASLRNSAWVGSRGLVSVASLLSLSVAANAALGDQGDQGEEGRRVELLSGEKGPVASKFIVEGRMHALIWAAAGARPRVRPPGEGLGARPRVRPPGSVRREGLSHQRAPLGDPSSTTAPLESRLIPFEDSWAASRLLSVLTRLEAIPGHHDISPTGAHTALKLFRVSTSHMVLKASPAYTTSDRQPVSMARELDEAEVQTVVCSLMDAARLRLMISPHRLLTIFSSLATSLSHQAKRLWMASLKGQEIEFSRSIAVLVVRSVSKRSSLQSASACLLPHRSSHLKRRLQTLKELCKKALNLMGQLQATSHLVDGSASNGRSSSSSVNKNQVAIIWSISALSGTLHRLNEKIQAAAEKRMLGPSSSIISPIHKKGEDGERKRPPPSFVKTRFNQSVLIRRVSLRRGRGGFSPQPNLPPSILTLGSSLGVTSSPLNLEVLVISMLGPEALGMLLSSLSYQHASISSSQPFPSHTVDALMDRVRSLLPDLNDGLLATALNLFSNLMEGAIHVHREGREFLMDGDERWRWTGFLDDVDVELGWRQSVEGGDKSLVACRRAREKMRGIVRH